MVALSTQARDGQPQGQPGGQAQGQPQGQTQGRQRRLSLGQASTRGWLAALPFCVFTTIFLILPIVANTIRSFQNATGEFSLDTMRAAIGGINLDAFVLTLNLSWITALLGGVIGLIIAWALTASTGGRWAWLEKMVSSFSALASQSGGVQLAYAFIALLGTQGLMTTALSSVAPGLTESFSITSFLGVVLVYLYFQVPLMTVLMIPAFAALKKEWFDAASSLGASRFHYVRDVAFPVLWPAMAGALLLLFANSFAAYATAYALAGGSLNLVPILIGFYISGNVLLDPGMAAALVTWMMLIIIVAMGLRLLLVKRSERWMSN